MRPTTREYNEWLPELQREVAAGKDFNILGMSIPTDTTPGHLGLSKKVHETFIERVLRIKDPLGSISGIPESWWTNEYAKVMQENGYELITTK